MYKLVFYLLISYIIFAIILSFAGVLSFSPIVLAASVLLSVTTSYLTNKLFAWAFKVPSNVESVYITALILSLIITPPGYFGDAKSWIFLFLANILAQAGKYIISFNKKHFFNPAAFAVAVTAIIISGYASWWVGTKWMLPFTAIGGYLIIRKIKREDLALSFLGISILTLVGFGLTHNADPLITLKKAVLDSPLIFFASIMLTEPLTMPPTKKLQIIYGVIVGLLFEPQLHFGVLYTTPEFALIAGNIFSYTVSSKQKLLLEFKQKVQLTADSFEFLFKGQKQFAFLPGQYLEWTLGHKNPDFRGNRRYFTIASSPTEPIVKVGVKFYPKSSSFKTAMLNMKEGDQLLAGQLAGDFTLPKNEQTKITLLAGGIGITPFVSMIKYLLDTKQRRDIILIYSNPTQKDIAYKNFIDEVKNIIGLKVFYVLTRKELAPAPWAGILGYITPQIIKQAVPDYMQRLFYISGPQRLVDSLDEILNQTGVKGKQIKKDFFPGF